MLLCYWLSYKYWGYPGCVCASYHQLARCLWNRFVEHMLYAYEVGQVYKGMLSTNRLTTNAFDSSTIEINMLRIYEIDFASGILKYEFSLSKTHFLNSPSDPN
ncbi:LOW QUALITY PROTEIN: hypothetical protein HID58_076727, partial [Brassica napus]